MDVLPLQILILKGVSLPDIFQAFDDNVPANTELPIPACTHLRGNILKVFLFRFYPVSHPLIGVVVTAGLILLKYIGPFSGQCFSQMFQQHFQRLVRGLLQQSDTKTLIDDGFQILNVAHAAVLLTASTARRPTVCLFINLP